MTASQNHQPSPLKYARLWQGLGWLMIAVVIWLTLTPKPPAPPELLEWDKSQHFVAYACLMFWFGMAFRCYWRWALFLIGLGVGLELIQGLGGVRTMDPYDMVANSLGVALGVLFTKSRLGRLLEKVDAWLPGKIFSAPNR